MNPGNVILRVYYLAIFSNNGTRVPEGRNFKRNTLGKKRSLHALFSLNLSK